ncbi:MAG: hypothetical protein U0T84_04920 [Chitinophagales bacterium]
MNINATYLETTTSVRVTVSKWVRSAGFAITTLIVAQLFSASIFAQGNVSNDQVIIVKEFEGKIKDADKVNFPPNVPEEETRSPKQTYQVPQRDFKDIPFEPNPLRPISMTKEKLERFNSSYLKLGFGSQLTPLAELVYNDNKTKNLRFGGFYHHLSQYGFAIKNMRYSDDRVGVYASYISGGVEITPEFQFHNLRTHFYGTTENFAAKDVRQNLRDYDVQLKLRNVLKNKVDIDYEAAVRFNYFQETFGKSNEWFVNGHVGGEKVFKKYHRAFADFRFDISKFHSTEQDRFRNIFLLKLGYAFNNDDWKARGAITLGADGSKFLPLPDLYIEKRLFKHQIIAFAQWEVRFQKNSYKSLAEVNNFVNSNLELQNTQISDFGAGLKGTVQQFTYVLKFQYRRFSQMPLFYTNYFDTKRFYVAYDPTVSAFGANIEMGWKLNESFSVMALADMNFYSLSRNARAWYEPALRFNWSATYNWKQKISATLDLYAFSKYYAPLAPGVERGINGTADLSLHLQYFFSKRWTFFGDLNNMAHQRYERWAGYKVFGVNGLVGVKFSF